MTKETIAAFRTQGGLRSIREAVPDDLFITCASYEPRTTAVSESFAGDYRSARGIIYVNKEFLEGSSANKTETNISRLKERLVKHCAEVEVVKGSWLDAVEQLQALKIALGSKIDENVRHGAISFDCTTFNRESLLTAGLLLRTYYESAQIRVLYVSPENHGQWLSRGFRTVRNVMGFAGVQQPSRSTVLMVLSGFEPERALRIIDAHEPAKVLLGIGDPPTENRFRDRNIQEQQLVLARQDVEEFDFPAGNIVECWKRLDAVIRPYLDTSNVVLAPMSTKLSTIATLLLAEQHPDVQVTYCVPGEYNLEQYSAGADYIYTQDLPKRG